jgi:hypothetical protein
MKKIKAYFLKTNSEVKSNAEIKALVNYSKALKESIKAEKELSSGSVELNQDQLQAIRNSCVKETAIWKYILDLIKADRGNEEKSILEDLLK